MALPSAVTVGSAAVLVAAGVGLAAWSVAEEQPAGSQASSGMSRAPTAEQTGSGRDVPTRSAAAGPSSDKPSRTKPDEPQPDKSQPDKSQTDLVPKVLIEVYNNSTIPDLAADKSAELHGAGWKVAATDNWYGAIPESTVYYPDDLSGEAERLAKTLKIDRVKPAVSPMSFDRLTVIFT